MIEKSIDERIRSYEVTQWWQKPQKYVDEAIRETIDAAEERLSRFQAFFRAIFPETHAFEGLVESPLQPLDLYAQSYASKFGVSLPPHRLWLKCDHNLVLSGSIKARGGFHEVLLLAEQLASEKGLINPQEDYSQFSKPSFKALFETYEILVGSTGNLGLSIGLIGAHLGFKVTVHMSRDAKQWKIDKLRASGTQVVIHEGDYGVAVENARQIAQANPKAYFVDDEQSIPLFSGYAVGGRRMKDAFEKMGIEISRSQPLYVYLPCGVGGGPGGVAYGLKESFGENVYPIFVEPTHAPCFLVAMALANQQPHPIAKMGLDNITEADGLAVGTASPLALKYAGPLLSGICTVEDQQLFEDLAMLMDTEGIYIEPSAAAGFEGLRQNLDHAHPNGIHLIWSTGGSLVPQEKRSLDYKRGKETL